MSVVKNIIVPNYANNKIFVRLLMILKKLMPILI